MKEELALDLENGNWIIVFGDVNMTGSVKLRNKKDPSITKGFYPQIKNVAYFYNNNLHRYDGPTDIYYDNDGQMIKSFWYYHGIEINCFSQAEFERYLRLKAFW